MNKRKVRLCVSLLVLVLAGVLGSCRRAPLSERSQLPNLKNHNVLIILSDALRADHLGCYGYHRNTSPFIDSLAAEGVVFERAIAPSTYTAQAVSALFSGQLPSRLGATEWSARPPDNVTLLAERFQKAGYATGFIAPTPVLADSAFKRGFDKVLQFPAITGENRNHPLVDLAAKFIAEIGEQPFFLYLHFFAPHAPYTPPRERYLQYAERTWPAPLTLGDLKGRAAPLARQGFGPGDPRFEDVILRYDAEIRDVDECIKRLFQSIRSSGKLDKTLVVLLADHGEEFFEHRFLSHAYTVYQEVVHVPLIFWDSSGLTPLRISRRVATVGLAPTLLALTGLPVDGQFDGRNLFVSSSSSQQHPIISELLMSDRLITRSVILGDWKYINSVKWQNVRDRTPGQHRRWGWVLKARKLRFDYWQPVMKEELYNLARDPGERTDLIAARPDKASELKSILDEYRRSITTPVQDRGATPEQLKQLERLKSLGYVRGKPAAGGHSGATIVSIPLYKPGDTLSIGSRNAELYLPYGWSTPEPSGYRWTDGEEALVWFKLSKPQDLELKVQGRTYAGQVVIVMLNGRRVGSLWPGQENHRILIPGRYFDRLNHLVFLAPQATSPALRGESNDGRMLGLYVKNLILAPVSGHGRTDQR